MQLPSLTYDKTASDLLEVWQPHPGPQTDSLITEAFELLYGGQAGGGKTIGLVAAAALQSHISDYDAVIFRKTYKQIEEAGGLEDRTEQLYQHMGGDYRVGAHGWRFPSGAEIVLRHMQNKAARYDYQGSEYPFIGFDQHEQFDEDEYLYLFSRVRSTNPTIRAMVRNTANPGAQWVLIRWLPWLGTDEELAERGLPRAQPGEVLWFKRTDDQDVICSPDDPDGLSRTFIPATIYDNPTLMDADPDYIRRLKALPFVERKRLLEGDWHVRAEAGTVFKREWFTKFFDNVVPFYSMVRAFDLAGTEKETQSPDPDFTATVLMGLDDPDVAKSYLWVLDAMQDRLSPMAVEKLVIHYHETEPMEVMFAFEQEPGQAGKAQIQRFQLMLKGRKVIGVRSTKDKVQRAGSLSSICETGEVRILKRPWNASWINHMINFPSPDWHDDYPDASSLCYTGLVNIPPAAKVVRLG